MSLKEILFMFKKEQEYAEKKNQIIFIVLGIIVTVTSVFAKKIPQSFTPYFYSVLIFITLTNLMSFLPQGRQIKISSFTIRYFVKKHSKKRFKSNNNRFNYSDWKNFDLEQIDELLDFFKIANNEENKMLCEQILITAKITYVKFMYFALDCSLISIVMTILVPFMLYK